MTPAPRALLLLGSLLLLGTLCLYAPAFRFEFVNLDDDLYVTANPVVRAGVSASGMVWALTTSHAANWHPLTWLSLMLDSQLFGSRAAVYHRTNVLLHAANVVLLFLLLARMTGLLLRSAFVAALFAVHPLHVESVAWISERKDVLSGLFFMLTLLAYRRYAQQPGRARALLVAATFALGLMAKPMLVSLPLLLLLLDVWPLERISLVPFAGARWRFLLREKLPLFALSALSCAIAWSVQQRAGALTAAGEIPLRARAANALVCALLYVRKTLWPSDLAVFYPHHAALLSTATVTLSALLLGAVTLGAWLALRSLPYLGVGWLWYLVSILPVLGLVQVGRQSMADRYTYLPSIGLFLLATFAAADLLERVPGRRLLASACGALVLAALSFRASRQLATWRDSTTLFAQALAVDPGNYLAVGALGSELARGGALEEAIERYREALRIEPRFVEARANLAHALLTRGRLEEAEEECRRALAEAPDLEPARTTLGIVLLRQGRREQAEAEFERALATAPDYAPAHAYLAGILLDRGQADAALLHCRQALRSDPESPAAHHNLGLVFLRQGRLAEARAELLAAVRAEPGSLGSRLTLGAVLVEEGKLEEARAQFQEVLRLDPANAEARRYLNGGSP